jgi:L-amino acid N-acyltransferase YncA
MIIRPALLSDAAEMAVLINEIIAAGGTTAYEDPFTPNTMAGNYITAPLLISCHVAEVEGAVQGFQALWHPLSEDRAPNGWAVIATFAKLGGTQRGVGSALFEATKQAARAAGIRTIDATIRADNTGGLAFYASRGFVDYDRLIGVALKDGTRVDRVRKRYDL